MNVLIVGGGRAVYFISRAFVAKEHHVTVINRDRDDCIQLGRRLKAKVLFGDGTDASVLEDAEARRADVVLAMTPYDQENLAVCQLAATLFGVRRTFALVNDPDHEEVFKELGIGAFATTPIIANMIEQQTSLDQITSLIPLSGGKVNITDVRLESDSPVVGMTLQEIELPRESLVAVLIRDDSTIVPSGATRLTAGDHVVLVTVPENHTDTLAVITGKSL